jgi:ElaB/YqjD/DUF883 family membrane-anchored ribosome-binding protein
MERVQQGQDAEFRPAVLAARALARFAADRSLSFPLPMEWHKRTVTDPITGKASRRTLGEQYLFMKGALKMGDKTSGDVRKVLLAWPNRWPAPREAMDAYHQALGIEGLLDLREKVTDAASTTKQATDLAKGILGVFAPGVGVVVLDKIAGAVQKGARITLDLIDDNKSKAEAEYAKARSRHEAAVVALQRKADEERRRAQESQQQKEERKAQEAKADWLAYGIGAAVGLGVVLLLTFRRRTV